MSSDVAIRVKDLSKCYRIYDKPSDRLKQMIFRGRKKYYRDFWALKNVSFEVKKGENLGIIGVNGSGKSTLLKMICGTLTPTSGIVETQGRVAAILELGSGFNPEFTGRENVYLNASILGLTKEEIDARYDDILAFADIGGFINQPIKTYSSGMVVRLAFAVIAHVNADILIIDEALSVGDAFFVQKCMNFLHQFMKTGTVLFVSHNTSAILSFCRNTILLENGRVLAKGTSKFVTELYLAHLYEKRQGKSIKTKKQSDLKAVKIPKVKPLRDMRSDFINASNLRNDIELFEFSMEAKSFGKGGAKIVNVQLLDEDDNPLSWFVGGEKIKIIIMCTAKKDIVSVIIGFRVKNRLGQVVFGGDTYLSYTDRPQNFFVGTAFEACFELSMPVLPIGEYTINAAVAEGTKKEHIQHHWIYDAISFKVHATSICCGVVGVPIDNCVLRQSENQIISLDDI